MNIKKILEEYLDTFKLSGMGYSRQKTAEVFVNPSVKEMDEASETIHKGMYLRFIANPKKKKLYVFKPSFYHSDVAKKINGEDENYATTTSFWGTAKKTQGKWAAEGSDTLSSTSIKRFSKYNWKWAEKYIPGISEFFKINSYSVHPDEFGK